MLRCYYPRVSILIHTDSLATLIRNLILSPFSRGFIKLMSLPAIDVPYCSIKSNPDINCCYPSNSFPKRSCPSINLIASPNDPRITCDWIHSNGYQTSATGRRRSIPSAIVWIIGYSNASSCDSPKHIVLQIIGQILHEA